MNTLEIKTSASSYLIHISFNSIRILNQFLEENQVKHIFIISNKKIWNLHGKTLFEASSLVKSDLFFIPDSEEGKSYYYLEQAHTEMLMKRCDRKSLIIAFGGGVVGDFAGFVAATFMRGIPFIQIPTTLLAQVDSSVGGKVAINHPLGKNLIGAFYPPKLVIIDLNYLKTLAKKELICGIGELLKCAYIKSEEFLSSLKENWKKIIALDKNYLLFAIKSAILIKKDIVSKDEFEHAERVLLNFGHSFAHALESYENFSGIKHGEAVLAGMIPALWLSSIINLESGICFLNEKKFIESIFKYDMDETLRINELVSYLQNDKKTEDGKLNVVLLDRLGSAHKIELTNQDLLVDAFNKLK